MHTTSCLNVGIVGGGLVGLSAAIALKRAGHIVEVFDKRDFKRESEGIVLSIAPNAAKVYERWGLDLVTACGGSDALQVRHVHGKTMDLLWQDSFGSSKLIFLRHAALHSGLLRHLDATLGHQVKLTLDNEVLKVDSENGIIYTEDGSSAEKDLIILSYGLKRTPINGIDGDFSPYFDSGRSFYRYLVPNHAVMADKETAILFQGLPDELSFFHYFEGAVTVVSALCEGGKERQVSVLAKHISGDVLKRDAKIAKAQLSEITKDLHPSLNALIQKAPEDSIFTYPLFSREPINRYVHGKAVLLGDSAHAMNPQLGQGASIGIESAGCLEALFQGVGKNDVASRLDLFEALRVPRCGSVHVLSNMFLVPNGHDSMLEKIKPFWYSKEDPPSAGARPLSAPFRQIIWDFDVFEATEDALVKASLDKPTEDQLRLW